LVTNEEEPATLASDSDVPDVGWVKREIKNDISDQEFRVEFMS